MKYYGSNISPGFLIKLNQFLWTQNFRERERERERREEERTSCLDYF